MSIKTMKNYFQYGKEPYVVAPASSREQSFEYPVTMENGNSIIFKEPRNGIQYNKMRCDPNGALLIQPGTQCFAPSESVIIDGYKQTNEAGVQIAWDVYNNGEANLYCMGQGGSGGFTFDVVNNTTLSAQPARVMTLYPNKLPLFTYGVVAVGNITYTSLSGTTASITPNYMNGCSAVYVALGQVRVSLPNASYTNITASATVSGEDAGEYFHSVTIGAITANTVVFNLWIFLQATGQAVACNQSTAFHFTISAASP